MTDEERTARVRARVEESLQRARAGTPPSGTNGTPTPGPRASVPPPRPPRESDDDDDVGALAGLARIAVSAAWHTSGWALGNSLRASRRLTEAALSPTQALKLARDVQRGAEGALLGRLGPPRTTHEAHPIASNGHVPDRTLRQEGEQLLRRSRDVRFEIDGHPAYERILSELAPDEGRVLLLLLLEGPQAAVDVRTGGPLGLINSRLIAPGISMIGARAGCRYVDRVPSYLNNLFRLGLIWFSRETLRDHLKYQVLEAQPEVLGAIHSVAQAKVVRRSIHLTPFGEDFCRVCLMPETVAAATLPAHSDPPEDRKSASPPGES